MAPDLRYRKVGLTAKSTLPEKDAVVQHVILLLQKCGATVLLDHKRADDLANGADHEHFSSTDQIDLLLVIGGDGTILRSVREMQCFDIPVVSINRGTVGFLAEIEFNEVDDVLPELLRGKGVVEKRSLVHAKAFRDEEEFFTGFALNEAVIAQGAIARLIDLQASVNGEELAVFRADGLIVSTPTGSTAYSLAAGGPIVYPTLDATILTPINPYSFSQKPIVIPSTYDVDVRVFLKYASKPSAEVNLTLDGQVYVPLKSGDRVCICGSKHVVQFLRRKQDTFFRTLRSKLKWGEGLEA